MPKTITLNPGAQQDFVHNKNRYSAFIGGVGSGKTFAGLVRALAFTQQPQDKAASPPRGIVASISYPKLRDDILPVFDEIVAGSGLLDRYAKSEKTAYFKNGARIMFRSLDRPDWLRGPTLSWFMVDEGREINKYTWDVLIGRLRQKGYFNAAWVTSTPNGYDWMWQLFHEDSPDRLEGAVWYNAPTRENAANLEENYIESLERQYSGKFYEQEVEGRFVGLVSGGVFTQWDSSKYTRPIKYDPEESLYSFWDFGVGDLGVVIFAQITHEEKELPNGDTQFVPHLKVVGHIAAENWGTEAWAQAFNNYCDAHFDGRRPDRNIGDPAGRQRSPASPTGSSVIDALAEQGVFVQPAPIKPFDFGVLVLDNMMAGGRVLVDANSSAKVAAALATHRWNTDEDGNRIGNTPIHDWTSHFCDALRYGAVTLLGFFPLRKSAPPKAPPEPGTMGHIIKQLTASPTEWLGQEKPEVEWAAPTIE